MKKDCAAQFTLLAVGVAVQLWQGGLAVASDPQAQILLPSDMPSLSGIYSSRHYRGAHSIRY